jgi:putative transcriptional regulator
MVAELGQRLLVAAPQVVDGEFGGTVVLLIQHEAEGSFGFIVNREAPLAFKDVLAELDLAQNSAPPELPVLSGGPVARESGWVMFDPQARTKPETDVIEVGDRLVVSTSLELLAEIAQSREAPRHILLLGYAGWAPGQLETELREGTWIPVDFSDEILFDTPVKDRWRRALAMAGIDPRQLVPSPSSALS